MKTWYLKLSQEERQYLSQCKEDIRTYAEKYGLTVETVRDKYAKLIVTGLFSDEQDLKHQLEESLEKSRFLAVKRSKGKVWISIYNGIATQGILARKSMTEGKDKVFLTECDSVLLRMRWLDILILSSIYNLIDKPKGIVVNPTSRITSKEIWNLLMPSVDYNEDFKHIVSDTVSKFRSLSGDVAILESENKVKNHIISSSFFIDDSADENGVLNVSLLQEYKMLCEQKDRVVRIEQSAIAKSKSIEEQVLRTYIVWRMSTGKNEHSKMNNAIRIETLQSQTGFDINANKKMFNAVCKSLNVNFDENRIWW